MVIAIRGLGVRPKKKNRREFIRRENANGNCLRGRRFPRPLPSPKRLRAGRRGPPIKQSYHQEFFGQGGRGYARRVPRRHLIYGAESRVTFRWVSPDSVRLQKGIAFRSLMNRGLVRMTSRRPSHIIKPSQSTPLVLSRSFSK